MRTLNWKLAAAAAVVASGLCLSQQAQAAESFSYVTDQSSYDVAAGTPVQIKLYLKDALTNGTSSVINADSGLFGAGVRVDQKSGTAAITGVSANTTDFGGPVSITPSSFTPSPAFIQLLEGISPSAATGVMPGTGSNPVPNQIFLGTLNVTAGSGPSTFTIGAYDNFGGNTLTKKSFYDLDGGDPSQNYVPVGTTLTTFTVGVQTGPTTIDAGPNHTFGNAQTTHVAAGGSFAGVSGTETTGVNGGIGTKVSLLGGTASAAADVAIKFRTRLPSETDGTGTHPPLPPTAFGLISDVADVSGITNGDKYVIQMSYDPTLLHGGASTEAAAAAAGFIYVASQDANGNWVNTVALNNPAGGTAASPVQGAWPAGDLTLGDWGVDTTNHVAWAVINHDATFAVVPEPASLGLLGLASLGLLGRKRRKA